MYHVLCYSDEITVPSPLGKMVDAPLMAIELLDERGGPIEVIDDSDYYFVVPNQVTKVASNLMDGHPGAKEAYVWLVSVEHGYTRVLSGCDPYMYIKRP